MAAPCGRAGIPSEHGPRVGRARRIVRWGPRRTFLKEGLFASVSLDDDKAVDPLANGWGTGPSISEGATPSHCG